MTSRRFFHELSFTASLLEKKFFSKRKSVITDHPCCLQGACPISPPSATLSETELNGNYHHVWREICWDVRQPPRLSHNPIAFSGFFLMFYGCIIYIVKVQNLLSMWLDEFSQIKHTHITYIRKQNIPSVPETSLLFSTNVYPTPLPKG